jgi:hypothetical protein
LSGAADIEYQEGGRTMADGFQAARLIPVSGISNATEAEMRATSALLSVLTVVRDLSVAMFSPLGASTARRASVEAFIETKHRLADGGIVRPDGLVQVTYGSSVWRALIEVKTGDNVLQADQLNSYVTLAREQGFDAVVTISNEIGVGADHPCEGVRIRANSRVRLAHISWTEVLAHAVQVKVHRGVSDPEQAWILGELIRYLKHPASGAMAFADMGASWTTVRDSARAGTLRKGDAGRHEVVQRWEQLIRFAALRLGSSTGADVQPIAPRALSDTKTRSAHLANELISSGLLDATIRVPGAAGDISITADLRARQLTASTRIVAPTDRGNRGRVTWLMRQLGDDVARDLMIESWPRRARQPLCATTAQAIEDRDVLLDPERRDLLRFRLIQRAEMGQARKDGGRSPGFIQSVTNLVETFYAGVLQQVLPWTPRPPQTRPAVNAKEAVDQPAGNSEPLDEPVAAKRANASDKPSRHHWPDQVINKPTAGPKGSTTGDRYVPTRVASGKSTDNPTND